MKWQRVYVIVGRMLVGLFLVWLAASQSARGQETQHMLHIGLQTMMSEVRLSAPQPMCVQTSCAPLLNVPAEAVLVCRPIPNGIAVYDSSGRLLTQAMGHIQLTPNVSCPPGTAPTAIPLIRLLGPALHAEGKSDRLYRGSLELIHFGGGLTVVNVVELEDYLLGVVPSEMCAWYPLDALKAQAIAARTYALKNIGRFSAQGFDLTDTASSQVYSGYCSEDPRSTRAVVETTGMVLTYNDDLIDAVYSSTCGGYTENASEAWGHAVPYLRGIADFDQECNPTLCHPETEEAWADYFKTARPLHCLQPKYAHVASFRWVKVLTRRELEDGLPAELRVGVVRRIVPLHRGYSGRITSLRLEGSTHSVLIEKELPICKAFGQLRSSAFSVETYRDDHGTPVVFVFWGAGWGHGLGMCQVGAVGLADEGWSYDRILSFYYNGIALERR